jgi:predicted anti-sigma-YlaC factor YlaD
MSNGLGAQHLVDAGLLDVQDLTPQRQDGLVLAVTTLLGAATGRVTFDDVDFAQGRILLLAVGQLARQTGALED